MHASGSSSMLTEEQKLKMQAAIEMRQAERGDDTSASEVLKPYTRKPVSSATDNGASENPVGRHEPKATLRANPAPKQERKSHSAVNGKPKKGRRCILDTVRCDSFALDCQKRLGRGWWQFVSPCDSNTMPERLLHCQHICSRDSCFVPSHTGVLTPASESTKAVCIRLSTPKKFPMCRLPTC